MFSVESLLEKVASAIPGGIERLDGSARHLVWLRLEKYRAESHPLGGAQECVATNDSHALLEL
jgi:hypothetical protein